jgi:RNA chaperone Hfq
MQTRTSVGRDFQDNLLGRLMERRQVTTLYLRNRMALRGRILEFDPYVLLLEPLDGSPPQMVYKSALVSISGPNRPQRGPGPMRRGPRPPSEDRAPRDGGPSRERPAGPEGDAEHPDP